MLADAKKAGVSAVLLTDHFRPPKDFIDGRWRGLKDGVLFVPGSEARGFLIYPMTSILERMDLKGPDFIDTVTSGDGMIFLSHIEERKDHSLDGLTGLEIYNRHWDAKQDKASLLLLAMKLTDTEQLAELKEAVRLYPDELFAFQCDYPKLYLDKWDEGTRRRRLTGIAANDCHHNQVFIVKMVDEATVLLGTNVDEDEKMRKVTAAFRPGIKDMTRGRKPGDVLVRLDTDPYFRSFRNSSTHVLAPRLDERAIRAALKAGHAFVAHDWMCDATGFRFGASDSLGRQAGILGDEVPLADGLKLTAKLPLPAYVRLVRHGEEVAKSEGKADFEFASKPGSNWTGSFGRGFSLTRSMSNEAGKTGRESGVVASRFFSISACAIAQHENGLHCACALHTHTPPAPADAPGSQTEWHKMDCIALARCTHPPPHRPRHSPRRAAEPRAVMAQSAFPPKLGWPRATRLR